MRDLAGWEMLLGAAVVLWVLWRFGLRGRGRGENLSREDSQKREPGETGPANDWFGLLLPLGAVFVFVLFLIYSVRG